MSKTKKEIKISYLVLIVFFLIFLVAPFVMLLIKSLQAGDSIGIENYIKALGNKELLQAMLNSGFIAIYTALISTILGLSFTIRRLMST